MSRRSARATRAPNRLELDISDTALQQVRAALAVQPQAAQRPKELDCLSTCPPLQLDRSQAEHVAPAPESSAVLLRMLFLDA